MEEGGAPRDVLRRRVRTAEFYYGHADVDDTVSLYDEFTDNFVRISGKQLRNVSKTYSTERIKEYSGSTAPNVDDAQGDKDETGAKMKVKKVSEVVNWLLIRPCIEHYMLAAIIGRGGLQHLGATLWGQTELSVFDDGQHGVWGMT